MAEAGERSALILGVTGQDGAYLAELLLEKGYLVHGMKRRSSSFNTARIDHLYSDPHAPGARFFLHYGDVTDAAGLMRLLAEVRADEVYNLAAQSHVRVSFDAPLHTADTSGLGALRVLEALRLLRPEGGARFYQASSSEMFGNAPGARCHEGSPFRPRSPYAAAKLHAYWSTVNYREAYGLHASNGILFNHEGPTRGETFVTRKISRAAAAVALGSQEPIHLGNLDAVRDWGHARDYVEGMWRITNHPQPGDYVLATGEGHSVREFVELAFREVGVEIVWLGSGAAETGRDAATGAVRVSVDPRHFRPAEVDRLVGDASKARRVLGWQPRIKFEALVKEMVRADLEALGGRRGA